MISQNQSPIAFPKAIIDGIHRDISQAHCSLNALVDLLRSDGQPDPRCLADVLKYIETALEESDNILSAHLAQRANAASGGHHA